MFAGFISVTLPRLPANQCVRDGRVAVAVITLPSIWSCLPTPVLNVRFRRRTHAQCFGVLASAATAVTVLHHTAVAHTAAVMLIGATSIALFAALSL
jgi:PAT family beta-lactamase induction signal transducer AmpG